jgi:hypothetical protein
MREHRTIFRKRVLKNAQIVLSDRAPKLECAVRNISKAGACLQVSTTYGIPANFDVIIEGAYVRIVPLARPSVSFKMFTAS